MQSFLLHRCPEWRISRSSTFPSFRKTMKQKVLHLSKPTQIKTIETGKPFCELWFSCSLAFFDWPSTLVAHSDYATHRINHHHHQWQRNTCWWLINNTTKAKRVIFFVIASLRILYKPLVLVTTWLRTLHPESNFKYHDSLGSLETALTSSMLRMCVDSFSAYVIELNGHTWSIRSLLEQFCFFYCSWERWFSNKKPT